MLQVGTYLGTVKAIARNESGKSKTPQVEIIVALDGGAGVVRHYGYLTPKSKPHTLSMLERIGWKTGAKLSTLVGARVTATLDEQEDQEGVARVRCSWLNSATLDGADDMGEFTADDPAPTDRSPNEDAAAPSAAPVAEKEDMT